MPTDGQPDPNLATFPFTEQSPPDHPGSHPGRRSLGFGCVESKQAPDALSQLPWPLHCGCACGLTLHPTGVCLLSSQAAPFHPGSQPRCTARRSENRESKQTASLPSHRPCSEQSPGQMPLRNRGILQSRPVATSVQRHVKSSILRHLPLPEQASAFLLGHPAPCTAAASRTHLLSDTGTEQSPPPQPGSQPGRKLPVPLTICCVRACARNSMRASVVHLPSLSHRPWPLHGT